MVKSLCIREEYTDKSGVKKVSWNKIGILFDAKNGNEYIKLYHIPNQLIAVFKPKEKEEGVTGNDESIEF